MSAHSHNRYRQYLAVFAYYFYLYRKTIPMSKTLFPLLLGIMLLITRPSAGQYTDLSKDILRIVEKEQPGLQDLYRNLHAHPELSLQEAETSEKIAGELEKLGFEVTRNVGGFGLVGVLQNGEGPVILLRTDMDALPITEKTGLAFASRVTATLPDGTETGVMHACGHDLHMTVFIGSARVLSRMKDRWSGTLVMIAQPAEEKGLGAKAMLDDGLFTRFPLPDAALALHISPELMSGTVGICPGPAFAGVNSINIRVKGKGGHGAYPNKTIDPIVLASRIVLDLQTIVSRELPPTEPAVVTVGSIHGGSQHNIIPDEVNMQLTLRAYSEETSQYMIRAIKRICNGIAASAGLNMDKHPDVWEEGIYLPPVINDPELAGKAMGWLGEELGEENVLQVDPLMAGEDFGRYGLTPEHIPILIYWLGVVDPVVYKRARKEETPLAPLHSPELAPESHISLAAGILATSSLAIHLFENPPVKQQ